MDIYSLILENKNLLEIIYAFIISFICLLIFFKTDRYFRISLHSGLRYFRNAFLFYSIAFFWKFLLSEFILNLTSKVFFSQFLFEYFLIMSSLFLLYSLIWKKFEIKKENVSSLINSKLIFFHLLAAGLGLIDCLLQTYFFLFLSQIMIFGFSFFELKKNEKSNKNSFSRLYSWTLVLGAFAWVLNFATAFLFKWNILLLINTGILNIIFFIFILFGILRITKKNSTA